MSNENKIFKFGLGEKVKFRVNSYKEFIVVERCIYENIDGAEGNRYVIISGTESVNVPEFLLEKVKDGKSE